MFKNIFIIVLLLLTVKISTRCQSSEIGLNTTKLGSITFNSNYKDFGSSIVSQDYNWQLTKDNKAHL